MKLDIKKFGPVSNSSFELKKLNIFIGESATGKSIVTKLIYLCNSFAENFRLRSFPQAANSQTISTALEQAFIDGFVNIFGNSYNDFDFNYCFADYCFVRCTNQNGTITVEFSEQLINKVEDFLQSYQAAISTVLSEQTQDGFPLYILEYQLKRGLRSLFTDRDYIYIPAGRGFFTLLSDNIFPLLEQGVGVDQLLAKFGSRFAKGKHNYTQKKQTEPKSHIQSKRDELLKGSYRLVDDEDRFYVSKDQYFSLKQISSGQQELLPALIVLQDVLRDTKPVSVIFEEPEAHLFPKDQQRLIELLIYMLDLNNSDNQLLITTHSPYLLSCINNLIYAGKLDSNQVEKQLHLDFARVSAYALQGGSATSILNMENQLVDATYMDQVSGDIAALFDALLDEEYGES